MERTTEYLKELQSLPLDEKVAMTKMRIVEWYEHWNGNVSVSFSGGKDSTVLLDIVRSIYPDVPAVFVDTGLEQPEIREFVRRFDNVTVVRPSMPFNEVLSTYGYPLISKEVSEAIWYARKNTPPVNKKLSGGGIQAEASRAVGPETDRGGALPEHETESAARTMDQRTQRPSRTGQHNMRRNMLCGTWRKPLPERERELIPKRCDDVPISCSNTMSPQSIAPKNVPIIRSGSPVSLSSSTPINGAISSSDYLKREREREYSDATAYPNATDYAQRSARLEQSASGRERNEHNSTTDRPIQSIGQLTLAKSLPCSGGGSEPATAEHNSGIEVCITRGTERKRRYLQGTFRYS